MSFPKISIVMPIYNTKKEFLREAISSIMTQSFEYFEYLIINDSPENKELEDIVKSYKDSRIKFLMMENTVELAMPIIN